MDYPYFTQFGLLYTYQEIRYSMSEELFFIQQDWQLFTNINTLPQQAGVSRHLLPKLIAKELTDNALDTNTAVEINHIEEDVFCDTILIRDYGKGFSGDNQTIADLFSIKRPLTSSKRLRLPLRGALGNGLRVVVAMVYCTNGKLQISTQGRTLRLLPQDDGTTSFEEAGKWEGEGTEIKITIPDNFFGEGLLDWANLALQLNRGENYQGKTNAFWYDSDSFYNLLLSAPKELSWEILLEFFEEITPSKIKKIIKSLALQNPISPEILTREKVDEILKELRFHSKPITAKKLGFVGNLIDFSAYQKDFAQFVMPPHKGTLSAEIPAVIEVFGKLSEKEEYRFFVNKTPITGDLSGSYYDKRLTIYGCGLSQTIETSKLKAFPVIWVNIITPFMPIVSNGKEPDLSVLGEAILESIKKILNQLKRQEPKSEADENSLYLLDKAPSQKQVVLENLEKAIEKASGNGQYRYSLRQLYYAIRPFVMEQTQKELKYPHFNQIITDYEYELGKDLEGVYRDERGTLLYPHTHEEIKLGTKTIERYRRPIFHFNKILYSEKEGFFEILKDAGFCERHDCALLTSKGFASRAARDVIDLLAETEEELLFFCIHDADISGTLIYQALQGATKARPERKVKIINLGLEAWEGVEMDLEVETLEKRSTKNPANYVLNYDLDWQNPKPAQYAKYQRWADWTEWLKSFRVELNAMDTPTFVKWLDEKMSAYDTVGKVVPNQDFLKDEAQNIVEANLKNQIKEEILKKLDIDTLIESEFIQKLPFIQAQFHPEEWQKFIKEDLSQQPRQSWRESFREILRKLLENS